MMMVMMVMTMRMAAVMIIDDKVVQVEHSALRRHAHAAQRLANIEHERTQVLEH